MEFEEELCQFIEKCPTPFQFTQYASIQLLKAGFENLIEDYSWGENPPKKGFVVRDDRALIAYNIGGYESGIVVGTHCDSPVLRLNFRRDFSNNAIYATGSEYGGAFFSRWFDRPLKVCGSIKLRQGERIPIETDAVALIPSVDFDVLKKDEDSPRLFRPIFGLPKSTDILKYILDQAGIPLSELRSYELSLIDAQPPKIIGANKEILASSRIDNLTSTFSALKAFLTCEPKNTINVLVVFDYEEVGSEADAGAEGDFLKTVLHKILPNYDSKKFNAFVARSLFVSTDNGQATHPNYMHIFDNTNSAPIGAGVLLKKDARGSYATELSTQVPVRRAADKIGVKLNSSMNRNDYPSSSTIGPIVSTQLGIPTVDIGSPMLAMHSIRETVAVKDVESMMKLLLELYNNYEEYRLK